MIRVHGLRQIRGGQRVLDLPDFRLAQGDAAAIVGPSGSGKSTLLAVLGGLLVPSEGEVVVADRSLHRLTQSALDAWRLVAIGFVPQHPHLLDALTVAENLELSQFFIRKVSSAFTPKLKLPLLTDFLDRLGIAEIRDKRPHALSRGQAQRVAIARALLGSPRVLLVDEPTANLDDDAAAAVLSLLQDISSATGSTLVVATHDARVTARMGRCFLLTRLPLDGAI